MNYFTSDLHFGHSRILQFERKEFESIEDHDEFIVNILKKLTPNDNLYILGDIGYIPKEFKNLKCNKYLLLGNHDKNSMKYYEQNGLKVVKYPFYPTKRILCSHEPHPVDDETLNVHGHLHNSIIDKDNYFNVNLYMNDYKLVSEKQLLSKRDKIKTISHKFKEEWYAPLYKFTRNIEDRTDIDENGYLTLDDAK